MYGCIITEDTIIENEKDIRLKQAKKQKTHTIVVYIFHTVMKIYVYVQCQKGKELKL